MRDEKVNEDTDAPLARPTWGDMASAIVVGCLGGVVAAAGGRGREGLRLEWYTEKNTFRSSDPVEQGEGEALVRDGFGYGLSQGASEQQGWECCEMAAAIHGRSAAAQDRGRLLRQTPLASRTAQPGRVSPRLVRLHLSYGIAVNS